MDNLSENAAKPAMRVPCEVYSRIVGYLRPVQDWNEGKQQEFAERRTYDVRRAVRQSAAEVASASPAGRCQDAVGQRAELDRPCAGPES